MNILLRNGRRFALPMGFALLGLTAPAAAQNLTLYADALAPGFQDWSWATHSLTNSSPVASGSHSISFEADGWTGLYFHSNALLDLAEWSAVRLAMHGGPGGGQRIRLSLQLGNTSLGTIVVPAAPAGTWSIRTLDLRAAGLATGSFDGVIFQDDTGGNQATLYLDDLVLVRDDSPPPPPTPVAVTIDPQADRRPVSPLIYGVNFGDAARNAVVGYPLRRWGGNSVTRYNWQAAVHNTGSDYFFQNIADTVANAGTLPHGSSSDAFVDETRAAGAAVILTAPTIGWTPLPERVKKWGFSIAQYGAQLSDECRFYGANPPFWCTADSGSGTCNPAVNTTGFCSPDGRIVGNDPSDTSLAIGPSFVTQWVQHVVSRVGTAAQGGVRFWALDNEPMLWNSTHRDVHPAPLTYDGLWSRTLAYASAIKAGDPTAKVLGPVEWGWCSFFTSAADAALGPSCVDGPDRAAHGGMPLLEWYLQQVCAHPVAGGQRPVDYLDVHFYPQGGVDGLGDGSSEDPATAARRLRSVRELWDPSYVSESWIAEPVRLIPLLRSWIDARCPGTGLAITEYKWGADDGASSALAHAEVLALFGREGVDLATRWVAPEAGSKVEDAFELFLSYDGAGSRVLGDSVRASSDAPNALGTYAIAGPDDRLFVLLLNRDTTEREATVTVAADLVAGAAPVFRFDAAHVLGPAGTVAVSASPDGFTSVLPARSATLVVLPLAPATAIFADGFESGGMGAWSSATAVLGFTRACGSCGSGP